VWAAHDAVRHGWISSLEAAQAVGQQLLRPQKRRRRHRRQRRRVRQVVVADVDGPRRSGPEVPGEERRAAEWAGALVVSHPTVETPAVERVAAVVEPAHFVPGGDAAQADGAVAVPARGPRQLGEPHHGERLVDEHGRDGPELGAAVLQRRVRPAAVRALLLLLLPRRGGGERVVDAEVDEVAQPHGVERPEKEPVEVAEEEEHLEQDGREHHLRVPHGESHRIVNLGAAPLKLAARLSSDRVAEQIGCELARSVVDWWRSCVRVWMDGGAESPRRWTRYIKQRRAGVALGFDKGNNAETRGRERWIG
jgi:hypothetical protein